MEPDNTKDRGKGCDDVDCSLLGTAFILITAINLSFLDTLHCAIVAVDDMRCRCVAASPGPHNISLAGSI